MGHPLESCLLKIELAKEAFDGLEAEIASAMEAQPYRLVVESNRQTGEQIVRVKIDHPPPLRWTSIASGQFSGSLRSALDQLVYALVALNGGDPERYRTQFPIFEDRHDYFQRRGKKLSWRDSMLRGVGDTQKAEIDRLQPFESAGAVEDHPLARLRQITDQDKHRVTPPAFAVWNGTWVWFTYPGMEVELGQKAFGVWLDPSKGWVMDDNHEVFRMTISTHANPTAYFDPKTPLRVAFGDSLLPLDDLRGILETVEGIVTGFKPAFGPGS